MNQLREVVMSSLEQYPEFDEFLVAIELAIDIKQTPGIRLDASKSAFESIVKTLLGYLDRSRSKTQLNRMSLVEASGRLFNEISRYDDSFNADFVEAMVEVIKRFSIARNNTGDISHGHVVPKENSTEHFVAMAINHAESVSLYLLHVFMNIDLSFELPELYDAEGNETFNNYLDESHEPIGQVLYSKALYDLDYEAWLDGRDNYEDS